MSSGARERSLRELLEDLAAELRAAGDVELGAVSNDPYWHWQKGYLTASYSISVSLDEILADSGDP